MQQLVAWPMCKFRFCCVVLVVLLGELDLICGWRCVVLCCVGKASLTTNSFWRIRYARVVGHLSNLCMAFLTFPVARNSLWEYVFGIPYERAIKYHRLLASLFYVLVTLHMLLFFISFAGRMIAFQHNWVIHFSQNKFTQWVLVRPSSTEQGLFWNNLFTLTNLKFPDEVNSCWFFFFALTFCCCCCCCCWWWWWWWCWCCWCCCLAGCSLLAYLFVRSQFAFCWWMFIGNQTHWDNFTVSLTEIGWIGLTLMVITAYW